MSAGVPGCRSAEVPSAEVPECRSADVPIVTTRANSTRFSARRQRIAPAVRVTPLVPASSDEAWAHLWLKCENLQAGGAFKLRGAFNFVSQLDPAVRARGVITYSSGNHGQAMALAARRLGAPAVVVMPTTAPAVKVDGARGVRGRGAVCGHDVDRPQAGGRGAGRRAGTDHRAALRSRRHHRGPGHGGPRDRGPATGRDGRLRAGRRRRAGLRRGRGGQAAGAVGASRWRRAGRRAEDDAVAGGWRSRRRSIAIDSIADGLLAVRPGDLTFAHVQRAGRRGRHGDRRRDPRRDAVPGAARRRSSPSPAARPPWPARCGWRRPGSRGVHVAVVSGGNLEMSMLARRFSTTRGRTEVRPCVRRPELQFRRSITSRAASIPSSIVVISPSSCRS